VYLELQPATAPHLRAFLRTDQRWFVAPQRALMKKLESLLDEECVVFKGKGAGGAANGGSSGGNGWRRGDRSSRAAPQAQQGVASEAVTRFD
jgi:hypothetical protein